MMVAGRVILGAGVGLEGGTVPVYVAETVEARMRGNLVSLYQFMIALGEVLGYAVAAMFITVKGSWRYILGSSLIFSTIMGVGILFMPESPRFLMHKGDTLEAFKVWKRIRGIETHEAREEFFIMKVSTEEEEAEVAAGRTNRFPWMDFFTKPRARRAIIYANIMIFLGQFTVSQPQDASERVLWRSKNYDSHPDHVCTKYLSPFLRRVLTCLGNQRYHVLHECSHEPGRLRHL